MDNSSEQNIGQKLNKDLLNSHDSPFNDPYFCRAVIAIIVYKHCGGVVTLGQKEFDEIAHKFIIADGHDEECCIRVQDRMPGTH